MGSEAFFVLSCLSLGFPGWELLDRIKFSVIACKVVRDDGRCRNPCPGGAMVSLLPARVTPVTMFANGSTPATVTARTPRSPKTWINTSCASQEVWDQGCSLLRVLPGFQYEGKKSHRHHCAEIPYII